MSTSNSQLGFILDQLSFLPKLTTKKMFGQYAFYSNDKYFGMICDGKVFLKANQKLIVKIGDANQRAYKGSKNSLHIPEEILQDKEILKEVFRLV